MSAKMEPLTKEKIGFKIGLKNGSDPVLSMIEDWINIASLKNHLNKEPSPFLNWVQTCSSFTQSGSWHSILLNYQLKENNGMT